MRSQYLGRSPDSIASPARSRPTCAPPEGMSWSGLRALFGAFDDAMFALAGPRHPDHGLGPLAPVLRPLRHADVAEGRRARTPVPELRADPLSAHRAGRHGAGAQARPAPARALAAFPAGHVQRARRLRRAGREPGAVPAPRGAGGSRRRGRQPALLRQPALAVSAFADDRVQLRLRRRRDHARNPARSRRRPGSTSTICRCCPTRSASRAG